jgi:hypothetical protein
MESEKDSFLCAQEPTVGQNNFGDQAKLFVTWKSVFKTYTNSLEYLILKLYGMG